jgi:hypothetical protein
VSGDGVRGSESRDAQQFPPTGAGTARAAGRMNGIGEWAASSPRPEIRWVGEQRLMEGYCGRAVVTGEATVAGTSPPARPVAVLQRPRGRVVRIGPRPLSCEPLHETPTCDGAELAAAA